MVISTKIKNDKKFMLTIALLIVGSILSAVLVSSYIEARYAIEVNYDTISSEYEGKAFIFRVLKSGSVLVKIVIMKVLFIYYIIAGTQIIYNDNINYPDKQQLIVQLLDKIKLFLLCSIAALLIFYFIIADDLHTLLIALFYCSIVTFLESFFLPKIYTNNIYITGTLFVILTASILILIPILDNTYNLIEIHPIFILLFSAILLYFTFSNIGTSIRRFIKNPYSITQ